MACFVSGFSCNACFQVTLLRRRATQYDRGDGKIIMTAGTFSSSNAKTWLVLYNFNNKQHCLRKSYTTMAQSSSERVSMTVAWNAKCHPRLYVHLFIQLSLSHVSDLHSNFFSNDISKKTSCYVTLSIWTLCCMATSLNSILFPFY